jgi:hypothetical protein
VHEPVCAFKAVSSAIGSAETADGCGVIEAGSASSRSTASLAVSVAFLAGESGQVSVVGNGTVSVTSFGQSESARHTVDARRG